MTNVDLFGPAIAAGGVTSRPTETRVFGTLDTWFRDCTDALTDDGTAYEAAYFNLLLANARAIARGNGLTGGGGDVVNYDNGDDLLWRACQHLYQRGQPVFALDTGVANSVILALDPAPAELKRGMVVRTEIAANNTGASTLTVNATVKDIKTITGAALQKGMLVVGQPAVFQYNGTYWVLTSLFSERVVFTPRASIDLAAIASMPNQTFTTHNTTQGATANLSPVVGANSWTLPDGTYLFIGTGQTRLNNVINTTHTAHRMRLTKNGADVGGDFEAAYLIAGADLTTTRSWACVASAVSTDVFAAQSYAGVTAPGDFNGSNALIGKVEIIRIGN